MPDTCRNHQPQLLTETICRSEGCFNRMLKKPTSGVLGTLLSSRTDVRSGHQSFCGLAAWIFWTSWGIVSWLINLPCKKPKLWNSWNSLLTWKAIHDKTFGSNACLIFCDVCRGGCSSRALAHRAILRMELCDLSDLRAYGKAVAHQGEDTGTSQKVLLSHGE